MSVVTDEGAADQVSPPEAQGLLAKGALLLDVREPYEFQAGHAPVAVHVPLDTLGSSLAELPNDRTIVAVCRSGRRSDQAAADLRSAGLSAVNLAGGMQAWQAAGFPIVAASGGPGRVA